MKSRARSVACALLVACLLLGSVPALAVPPAVPSVSSPSHPSANTWYADDSPEFEWDAASDLPKVVGSYDLGDAWEIEVVGDVAYVLDRAVGLILLDISDPAHPVALGSCGTPGEPTGLAIDGDYAYVADGESGLQVIDVSDPTDPGVVGWIGTPLWHGYAGWAVDAVVAGDIAYVLHSYGLIAVDVSDPTVPVLLDSLDFIVDGLTMELVGDLIYVADGANGLAIVDVSDPNALATLGTFGPLESGDTARGIDVQGNVAYLACIDSGVSAIDVSDPLAPVAISNEITSGVWDLRVAGDTLYVAGTSGTGELLAFDSSDPSAPVLLGTCELGGFGKLIEISGDYAFVCAFQDDPGEDVLRVIKISDFDQPTLLGSCDTPDMAMRVAVSGDMAFVADASSGMQVVDVTEPTQPSVVSSYDTTGTSQGVVVDGDTAYLADGAALRVLDIKNPLLPVLMGSLETLTDAKDVVVAGNTAYVAAGEGGLLAVDVSDPGAPTLLGAYDSPGYAWSTAVDGGTAFLADGDLLMVDVSDPSAPSLIGTYDATAARGVVVAGDTAYVADGDVGLLAIDVSHPAAPVLLDSLTLPAGGRCIALSGDTAYVSDMADPGSVHSIDVSDPANLTAIGSWTAPDFLGGFALAGTVVYAAAYESGLSVLDVGHGPVGGYSYKFDKAATTVPDTTIESRGTTASASASTDGDWYFHVRSVGEGSRGGETTHRRIRVDTTAPSAASAVVAAATGSTSARITWTAATDAASGVALYRVCDATSGSTVATTAGTSANITGLASGSDYEYYVVSVDGVGLEGPASGHASLVTPIAYTPLEGSNRYATSVAISKAAFSAGITETVEGKKTVVVATGANWPDALGGASLAGAYGGPILLTAPTALPSEIASEVVRLGATRVAVLGSEKAVSEAVRAALDALPGVETARIAGADRYATARAVAAETVRVLELSGTYDGTAFVATGANFPDALAASPLAAANGWPLYLAKPTGIDATTLGAMEHEGVTDVLVLGSDKAVSAATYAQLDAAFDVMRLEGANRYATARRIAEYGVASAGLSWHCVAIATGQNFPDALSGGVLQGRDGGVLLLTPSTVIAPECKAALVANKTEVDEVRYLGSGAAVSAAVRAAVQAALE